MNDIEFDRINRYIHTRYGIDLSGKKEIVDGRLTNMLRHREFRSYMEYMDAVEKDTSGNLEKELVNLLTTNHTYFMREFEHLEFLKAKILPYLKEKERLSKDLRIWCGASSSGEEPYMIAMTVLDFFGLEKDAWDTQILATDIDTKVLQMAIKGEYSKEAVAGLPENWKRRYFTTKDGETYQVSQELKKEVLFRQFNLMEPFPFRRKMHVIFLRNVMIYFNQETRLELVKKIYDFLEPGGYLIVGKTETIDRGQVPFEMVMPSVFRKSL